MREKSEVQVRASLRARIAMWEGKGDDQPITVKQPMTVKQVTVKQANYTKETYSKTKQLFLYQTNKNDKQISDHKSSKHTSSNFRQQNRVATEQCYENKKPALQTEAPATTDIFQEVSFDTISRKSSSDTENFEYIQDHLNELQRTTDIIDDKSAPISSSIKKIETPNFESDSDGPLSPTTWDYQV